MVQIGPAVRTDGRLPLVIVGGFLGAGKSTWLRHQLHIGRFGRVHVIVNEAAETPVDDILLSNAQSLAVLAGGCACCDGWAALRDALVAHCNVRDGEAAPACDRIVLETSGLADPAVIAAAIAADQVLSRRIAVQETIVVADAPAVCDQLAHEALARRQIEAAGAVVVTKFEHLNREQRSQLAAMLRTLAPGAALSWCEFGQAVAVNVDEGAEPLQLPVLAGSTEPMRPYRLDASGGASWSAMSVWLSALLMARGDDIVRVKGVMRTPAGRLLLQSVRKHVQPAEILPESGTLTKAGAADFLVLIGRGIDEQRLLASWRKFVLAKPAKGRE